MKLLPCPFCDGEAVERHSHSHNAVNCGTCCASVPQSDLGYGDAGKLWNRRAALSHPSTAQGWQPIESAPKDGIYTDGKNHYAEYILAWWPGALAVTRVRWWYRDDSDACNFIADGGYAVFPSVFQPLPTPPEQGGKG